LVILNWLEKKKLTAIQIIERADIARTTLQERKGTLSVAIDAYFNVLRC
jgi:hypothetical protein